MNKDKMIEIICREKKKTWVIHILKKDSSQWGPRSLLVTWLASRGRFSSGMYRADLPQ